MNIKQTSKISNTRVLRKLEHLQEYVTYLSSFLLSAHGEDATNTINRCPDTVNQSSGRVVIDQVGQAEQMLQINGPR